MKVLAFSGGKDSMACLHLMRDELACAIYVDAGFSYPETARLVEYAGSILPMHIVRSDRAMQNARQGVPSDVIAADWTALGQAMTSVKPVMMQAYMLCYYENIIAPLWAKAREIGATHLVFGQRADESHRSTSADGTEIDGIVRVHPIESWSYEQVMAYLATKMQIPEHYAIKHSSLDCYDCTAFRAESADRIAWTKERYPEMFAAYEVRRVALDGALKQAME